MTTSFGIAVVHFGDTVPTRRCLESIQQDTSAVSRKVVVVDNSGNFPDSDLPPGVERLESADNPGFGEGANRGLRFLLERGSPRWLLVLNHDVELDSGFLDAARQALETRLEGERRIGAAAGPIYSMSSQEELWYAGGSINYLTGTVRQSRTPEEARRAREVGFLPGTALALSTVAFEEVGGFDPRFFLYNEDVDLCRRLRRRGWRLFFHPDMSCRHRLGGATGSATRSPLYLEQISGSRFLPFRNRWYRAYLGVIHTPYVLGRCLAALLRGPRGLPRVGALLRGHGRALKSIVSG